MNQLNITLHGDRFTTVEIPDVGAKCLAVMTTRQAVSGYGETEFGVAAITWPISTGYLDIHGKPRAKVWTRLAASAFKGDMLIRTVESVDFAPGETIVVAFIGDMNKAERMVVAALLDQNTVQLTAPLLYDHLGKIVPAQAYGFDDVYMFPEVGLLSRNIVIQGDDDTSDEQLFGVHTGVFMGGVYRIENAELRRCGQQGALGRYCTHAHMLNDNFLSCEGSRGGRCGARRRCAMSLPLSACRRAPQLDPRLVPACRDHPRDQLLHGGGQLRVQHLRPHHFCW